MREPRRPGRLLLLLAGGASLALAALHVVLIFVGPAAYRYFGAGEGMAHRAEAGSLLPAATTVAVAAVLCVFGLYALAGAALIGPLPLLRTGLVAVAAIYTLRGLSLFPQILYLLRSPDHIPVRFVVFSAVALGIGLVHIAGLLRSWSGFSAEKS